MSKQTVSFKVYGMQPDHLDEVVCIAANSDHHAWSRKLLVDSLNSHRCFVLVMSCHEICSVVAVGIFQLVLDEAELLYLVVNHDLQGKGIGTLFLSQLLDQLNNEGIVSCILEVRSGNTPAQHLYQRLGFVKVGARKGYYAAHNGFAAEDALILRCELTSPRTPHRVSTFT